MKTANKKTANKKTVSKKISWQFYALVLIGVLIGFLRMHSVGDPLTRDTSMYAYDAHELILGSKMYTDIFSMRAPGIQATYALAELLWGYGESSVYLLGVFFTLISLLFLFLFINLLAGGNIALIGVVLYGLSSNSLTLEANQPNGEIFINTYTIIAFWAFAKFSKGNRGYLVVAGLSFAIASLYKQTVVFPFLAMALYVVLPQSKIDINIWLKESVTKLLKFSLPSVVVWLALFAYFFLNGRFGDFWGDVFLHSQDYSGNIWLNIWNYFNNPSMLFHVCLKDVWVLIFLSFFWAIFSNREYGPIKRSFFIVMFFGIAAEIASPGKGYPHYYQHLLPLLCTVSALFFKDFYEYLETKNKAFAPTLIGLLLLFVLGHLSYPQFSYLKLHGNEISLKKFGRFYPEVSEVAEFVKSQTQECETVYEWGGEPGIYYYSKRRSASPISHVFAFIMGPEDVRSRRLTRVYKKILSEPPAIFIWNRGDRRSYKLDERFQKFVSDNYRLSKKIGSYYIYGYKNRTKCG